MSTKSQASGFLFDNGPVIDLPDILTAREERVHLQEALLRKLTTDTKGSLLIMTMAIPGPIKTNDHLKAAFDEMQAKVRKSILKESIIEERKREKITGSEYYLLSSLSPHQLKTLMVEMEETHPLGRFFDLDVHFLNNDQIVEGTSRTQLGLPVRRCFICDQPAKECGRSRRHSIEELQQKISKELMKYDLF